MRNRFFCANNGNVKMESVSGVIFALFLSCMSASAQDVITLRSGEQIRARVTEISPSELRYRQFDNLDGPTRVVLLSEVFAINYENGTREVINSFAPASQMQTATPVMQVQQVQTPVVQWQSGGSMQPTQGDMAIGGSVIINSVVTNENMRNLIRVGIGAKFLYNATDNFRLAGEIDFFPIKSAVRNYWDFSAYGHYLISAGNQFMLYPSLGLGFTGAGTYRFAFSLGGGLEVAFNPKVALNSELRFKLNQGGGYQLNVAVAGIIYKF